jgi:hypothetical protein
VSITDLVNLKEDLMSTNPQSSESGAGGKGIFIALIPWIVFTVLASHATLKIGSLVALAAAIVIAVTGIRAGRPKQYWGSPKFKQINRRLTTMWGCIFAAMVPSHVIAGTLDTKLGNIIFNWAVPLALVVWGIKRSSGSGESRANTVQQAA